MKVVACLLVLALASVHADVYMHYPRGSNNRLNEQGATRNNGNRLFDSQNNNRGGYNVADRNADASQNQNEQYNPQYFVGSRLMATWTNQHGCGGGEDRNHKVDCTMVFQSMCDGQIRNGQNTNTPDENDSDQNTGRHESPEFYDFCKNTCQRNQGLWTADQNLNGDTCIYTRQNPNGGRSGLECPEERDYFPWWHPNPFKTWGVMTYDTELIPWYEGIMEEQQPGFPVVYGASPWSRQNHLGNGRDLFQNTVNFTVPSTQQLCDNGNECRCIFRIRYNMSTSDVPHFLNSTFNGNASPVRQNPTVSIGVGQGLKLAINTAQTGRTFQDRSHVFYVRNAPGALQGKELINFAVQGKRGNIVQVYPAVEYDFVPTDLRVAESAYICMQFEGSNTHNNNPGGGDGQTGDAGEGTGGTDRSNLVQTPDRSGNFPLAYDRADMWEGIECVPPLSPAQIALQLATNGGGADTDVLLNNAPASYYHGCCSFRKGVYHFMCTRNNNFSNRSQKGTFTVD